MNTSSEVTEPAPPTSQSVSDAGITPWIPSVCVATLMAAFLLTSFLTYHCRHLRRRHDVMYYVTHHRDNSRRIGALCMLRINVSRHWCEPEDAAAAASFDVTAADNAFSARTGGPDRPLQHSASGQRSPCLGENENWNLRKTAGCNGEESGLLRPQSERSVDGLQSPDSDTLLSNSRQERSKEEMAVSTPGVGQKLTTTVQMHFTSAETENEDAVPSQVNEHCTFQPNGKSARQSERQPPSCEMVDTESISRTSSQLNPRCPICIVCLITQAKLRPVGICSVCAAMSSSEAVTHIIRNHQDRSRVLGGGGSGGGRSSQCYGDQAPASCVLLQQMEKHPDSVNNIPCRVDSFNNISCSTDHVTKSYHADSVDNSSCSSDSVNNSSYHTASVDGSFCHNDYKSNDLVSNTAPCAFNQPTNSSSDHSMSGFQQPSVTSVPSVSSTTTPQTPRGSVSPVLPPHFRPGVSKGRLLSRAEIPSLLISSEASDRPEMQEKGVTCGDARRSDNTGHCRSRQLPEHTDTSNQKRAGTDSCHHTVFIPDDQHTSRTQARSIRAQGTKTVSCSLSETNTSEGSRAISCRLSGSEEEPSCQNSEIVSLSDISLDRQSGQAPCLRDTTTDAAAGDGGGDGKGHSAGGQYGQQEVYVNLDTWTTCF